MAARGEASQNGLRRRRALRDVRFLLRRLRGAELREEARRRGLTPGQARLLEGHLFAAVVRVGAEVRALEAFREAAA